MDGTENTLSVGIHRFSQALLAFSNLETKQAIFPHKCCAQSVMVFFSFGVFIYMYVIFLSGKKWPTVMELVPLKNLIILIL